MEKSKNGNKEDAQLRNGWIKFQSPCCWKTFLLPSLVCSGCRMEWSSVSVLLGPETRVSIRKCKPAKDSRDVEKRVSKVAARALKQEFQEYL